MIKYYFCKFPTFKQYVFIVTEEVELVANFQPEVGIESIKSGVVKIYPNPTKGVLNLIQEIESERIEKNNIFDIYGRELQFQTFSMFPETTIDISHLSAGVYFIKVYTKTGEVVRKVVKE